MWLQRLVLVNTSTGTYGRTIPCQYHHPRQRLRKKGLPVLVPSSMNPYHSWQSVSSPFTVTINPTTKFTVNNDYTNNNRNSKSNTTPVWNIQRNASHTVLSSQKVWTTTTATTTTKTAAAAATINGLGSPQSRFTTTTTTTTTTTITAPIGTSGTSRNFKRRNDTLSQDRVVYDNVMEFQQPQKNHTQKRSNNKTPSGNQSFHSKQKPTSTQQQQQQLEEEQQQTPPPPGIPTFRDEFLPCRRHLDPEGTFLPTSDWVQVDGTLALTSLEELVMSIENILYEELEHGVIDLEALWNPQQQGETVPLLPIQDTDGTNDDDNVVSPHFRIQAAHLMLSPFGRPTGWHLKLSNPSMVHALITRAESKKRVHVAWKMVLVKEYHPPTAAAAAETETEAPTAAKDGNAVQTTTTITNHINGFLVDNTMVRFENCPESLTEEHLRYLLSRYELARFGPTVMQWEGQTAQGKRHRMFVARFHDATWARAAVREKQDLPVGSRRLRLIQYPNQRLLEEKEQVQEEQQQQELHQKTA